MRRKLQVIERFPNAVPQQIGFGSDLKKSGGVHGRCRLCCRRRTLRLSHVIPKWAYYWHKKARGGYIEGTYYSLGVRSREQDGRKHYLLCEACEQYAGVSENYIKTLIFGPFMRRLKVKCIKLFKGHFLGFNSRLAVRFLAVIAIRAHYAKGAPYHNISFEARHLRQLRRSAFSGELSEQMFYGIAIFAPPDEDPDHDPCEDIILQYIPDEPVGPLLMPFIGGWEWYLYLDRHRSTVSLPYSGRITSDALMVTLPVLSYYEHRSLMHMKKS